MIISRAGAVTPAEGGIMYQVLDDTQFCMMSTDSFYKAVCYAHECAWTVYDTLHRVIIYDGARDEFFREEV